MPIMPKTTFLARLAVLALFCLAAPLAAQPLVSEEPIPSAGALARMCSVEGAMQFKFGQNGVPGSSKIEHMLERGFKLPPALAPFAKAQPRSTQWSDRFMEMTYRVEMPKAEDLRAQALIDRIGAALEGSGWSVLELTPEDAPLYLIGYAGSHAFTRPVTVEGKETSVLLALSHDFGELSLTCGRDDLLLAHANEAFGKLPPGTPRPKLPEIAVPQVRSEAECADPARLAEIDALLVDGKADRFTAAMLGRTSYRDRLTTWMMWKLESSGKIGPDRLLKIGLSSLSSASPGGNPFAALAMIEEMFPIVGAMDKAARAQDRTAMCRSLIPFQAWMTKVDAITLKQSEGVQASLQAEATRLGISLDE